MKKIRKVFCILLAVLLSTGTSIWAAEKNETKGIQEVNIVADSEKSGTYKEYYCRRKITVHGTESNPVYVYRGGEHTSVTDVGWDKYNYEATIWCWGYSYSPITGYRYIADATCGGGSSKGQIIRVYIPFSANVTLYSISHTYSFPESVHPHKKYCDCGVSATAKQ